MTTRLDNIEERLKEVERYVQRAKAKWELFTLIFRALGPILVIIGMFEIVVQYGLIK